MALTTLERRLGLDWPPRWRRWLDLEDEEQWLRVEEVREDGALTVRAELPGIDPEHDLQIEMDDGVLSITAHREERAEHEGRHTTRSEFRYGEFRRRIPLPKGTDAEAVEATYHDGILEVRVPWPEQAAGEPTRIAVTRS